MVILNRKVADLPADASGIMAVIKEAGASLAGVIAAGNKSEVLNANSGDKGHRASPAAAFSLRNLANA